jgi:hypothetical protein
MSDIHPYTRRPVSQWPTNPLVTLIRQQGSHAVAAIAADYQVAHGIAINLFDLMIQVMLVACSYPPADVWLANSNDVAIAALYVAKGADADAREIMEVGVSEGSIRLNNSLITAIAQAQAKRLAALYARGYRDGLIPYQNAAACTFAEGAYMKGFALEPLSDGSAAYATAGSATVQEGQTSTAVYFRPVPATVSSAYAISLHYLHAPRTDELIAFGAFKANETMPFAWVSYAPVARQYKRNTLRAQGINPAAALELTRAWNCDASPKNTMSMLYAYAHACLQRAADARHDGALEAILTDVNPNLGFTGSAFRAVGMGVVGTKPTEYYYQEQNGQRHPIIRREVERLARISHDAHHTPRVIRSVFPLCPAQELAVALAGTKRTPLTGGITHVSYASFAAAIHI